MPVAEQADLNLTLSETQKSRFLELQPNSTGAPDAVSLICLASVKPV